jgi:TctA family transporter
VSAATGVRALLPRLTRGIPGSPAAALPQVGLLICSPQPGPMRFIEQNDFAQGLIASMNPADSVARIGLPGTVPWRAAIRRIRLSVTAPVIIVSARSAAASPSTQCPTG